MNKYIQFISAIMVALTVAQDTKVSVPVTIPVTIPFTVDAGQSFEAAAQAFCQRNGLSMNEAPNLKLALEQEWERIQNRNQIARCFEWQRRFSVAPMKSWGTMPDNMRIQWLDLKCENVVPKDPPSPTIAVPVQVYDTNVQLNYFEGENVDQVVENFCSAYGVNLAQYGAPLKKALVAEIEAHRAKQPAQQQQQQQLKEVPRGTFLFSIPITIDDKQVKLDVHEGDEMGKLVGDFCKLYDIPFEQYGEMLKQKVMEALVQLQQNLLQELNTKPTEQENQQTQGDVVFSVSINIDGNVVPMNFHEGDVLATRVSEFCTEHGIKEEDYGQALRTAVLQRYRAMQAEQA